jgi:hypothetical protein
MTIHVNAIEHLDHGLYYVLPDERKLFIGQQAVDDSAIRALSPLARAVMRAHLETAIKLLDRITQGTTEAAMHKSVTTDLRGANAK